MQRLLNHGFELVEKSAVEALMATLVVEFDAVGREVWRIQDSPRPMTEQEAAQLHQLYGRLCRVFDEVLVYGRFVEETSDSPIAGKSEFLAAWRELKGIVAVDPSYLTGAVEELRSGSGKSLGEFADELSRDLKH